MNILWCVTWSFRVKSPQKINKIKKTWRPWFVSFPSPNLFLFRILFTVPTTWQCVDHKNVVVPEALRRCSAGQTLRVHREIELEIERVYWLLEYCYCNLNKKSKNYVLNLVNFSKFENIPSWIWLLFFGTWFQLLFWMVTGLPIFRPLPVLMKLNTESALLD